MPSVSEWVLIQRNAPQYYWLATVAAVVHPTTRSFGLRMGSFGVRASANVAFAGARALAGTTLLRGGSLTLGSTAGSVAAGYAIGAVVGTGISYAVWGDEGAKDALYFYSHPVKATKELFS